MLTSLFACQIAESVAQLQDLIAYSLETGTGPISKLGEVSAPVACCSDTISLLSQNP